MAKYMTQEIRNVALAGHGASGKTTLIEAMLHKAKATTRRGSVAEGNTVSDFDQEEKDSRHSIDISFMHLTWKGAEINLLDTPGYPDFIGEAAAAIGSVGALILAVDATAGVKVNTRKVWQLAEQRRLPRAIVITRADADHARWDDLLEEIKGHFGDRCVPMTFPTGHEVGPALAKVELAFPCPAGASEEAAALCKRFIEVAVESDEALMVRYLDGEDLAPEVVKKALHQSFRNGAIVPIFVTSAEKDIGVDELLTTIAELLK
jgi:elongation factor G